MMIRRLPQQDLLMQLCSAMAGETSGTASLITLSLTSFKTLADII